MSVHAAPLFDGKRHVVEWFGMDVDITEQKRAEEAVENSRANLEAALESMVDAVCITDSHGSVVLCNGAYGRFLRIPSVADVPKTLAESLALVELADASGQPLSVSEWPISRALRGEAVRDLEYVIRLLDSGESWPCSCSCSPVRDQVGTIVGAVFVGRDITERKRLEDTLAGRTSRLQAVLDTAYDAILMLDQGGTVVCGNPASLAMFQVSQEELVGNPLSRLLFGDSRVEFVDGASWPMAGRSSRINELWGKRFNGDKFPAEVSIAKFDNDGGYACFVRDVSERNELQRHLLDAAAEEQRRLACELHDGVQQELTGLALLAGTLQQLCAGCEGDLKTPQNLLADAAQGWQDLGVPDAREIVARLFAGLVDAQRSLRQVVSGMMPVLTESRGLQAALESLGQRRTIPHVEVVFSGDASEITGDLALHVYRIAQEAVANALKHSGASKVSISLRGSQGEFTLEVADDGSGFDPAQPTSGIGLRSMKYRAGMVAGSLEVLRNEAGGATVRCVFRCERPAGDGVVPSEL